MLKILLNWIRAATRDAVLAGVEDAFAELDDGIGPSEDAGRFRDRLLAVTAKGATVVEAEAGPVAAVATVEAKGKRGRA